MRALALLIGIADYPDASSKLFNATKDAISLGASLQKLGFDTRVFTDLTIRDMDEVIGAFGNDLDQYDIGLFFYAGHGFQVSGENYLSAKDTEFTLVSAARTSHELKNVLGYMERASNSTNIIILDCCREDLFRIIERHRSIVSTTTLAPVHAPKGTLIAYSTSPGETASDGTSTSGNGLYTRALLEHLEIPKISIEDFFKNVRNSVATFSCGRQTTWEHTSLTGHFSFNSGTITHASVGKYGETAIADSRYVLGNDKLSNIIEDLKSHTYGIQNDGIDAISSLKGTFDADAFFVLGRNIIQAAEGNSFSAQAYIRSIRRKLKSDFEKTAAESVLDGMLFEVYFDKEGKVREEPKSTYLGTLLALKDDDFFKLSFEFINEQLAPHSEKVFFTPSDSDTIKSVEVFLEKETIYYTQNGDDFFTRYLVKSISFQGEIIMTDEDETRFGRSHHEELSFERFKAKLSSQLGIPEDRLRIITNIVIGDDPVVYLWGVKLRRRQRSITN